MGIYEPPGQRALLFNCAFTCVYFPSILLLLKFNESLCNVGNYKFMPVLIILMFAEVIKLGFSLSQGEKLELGKLEVRPNCRTKKTWLRGFKEFVKFFTTALVVSAVYYAVIILLGASVFARQEETITLTVTLTVLTFVPTCLHLGVDAALIVLTRSQPQGMGIIGEAIGLNIRATLLGAWLGAIVIPLDWNRPWQAWPVPCVLGALFGYALGHFVTLVKVSFGLGLRKKVHR